MAYVSDHPVRIREFLEDGTAHDVTVRLVPDGDHIQVLDDEAAVTPDGPVPPVHYTAEEAAKLPRAAKSVKAAKSEEAAK